MLAEGVSSSTLDSSMSELREFLLRVCITDKSDQTLTHPLTQQQPNTKTSNDLHRFTQASSRYHSIGSWSSCRVLASRDREHI